MGRMASVCVVAMLVAACASMDSFTFAEDDLCDWVSEDEVTSFVREAYAQSGVEWDGSVVAAVPEGSAWDLPDRDYCRWETPGGGFVVARGLTTSHFDPIESFSEEVNRHQFAVSGHPDFAHGIIVAHAAFGRYGFWVEGSDEVLGLEVSLGDLDAQPLVDVGGTLFRVGHEELLFEVANGFLSKMNWTPHWTP